MPAPELLLIKRMEDLQTELIGRCESGQFLIVDSFPVAADPDSAFPGSGRSYIYVMRYLFTPDGVFFQAEHMKIEYLPDRECSHLVEEKKREFLNDLGLHTFCDITVKLFAITVDGVKFGLLYSEETESINLEPGPIITFMEPWDGEYYT